MRLTEHLLTGDGDFRSEECVKLLDEADIVVTNPPFSLFREYIRKLMENRKKFLIIGPFNLIRYKDTFKYFIKGFAWLGWTRVKEFKTNNGETQKFGNITWFTNLDRRHEKLVCTEHYTPEHYQKFDNYDAINVDKVSDIPCDWNGIMGVPITFLDKYNQEQFEIVGELNNGSDNEWDYAKPIIDGKKKYSRILIRRRK